MESGRRIVRKQPVLSFAAGFGSASFFAANTLLQDDFLPYGVLSVAAGLHLASGEDVPGG